MKRGRAASGSPSPSPTPASASARQQQANLFSNFSQANPSIAAKYGGTGLGLSLSQNLCRLMGGRSRSRAKSGKGAASPFICRPMLDGIATVDDDSMLKDADRRNAHTQAGPMPALAAMRAGRIASTRRSCWSTTTARFLELAERLLLKEGYSPISTDAPEAVLQIARTVRPAAIFLDVVMPGLNGWDVLHTLRSDPVTVQDPGRHAERAGRPAAGPRAWRRHDNHQAARPATSSRPH